jgi:hypothetical protein
MNRAIKRPAPTATVGAGARYVIPAANATRIGLTPKSVVRVVSRFVPIVPSRGHTRSKWAFDVYADGYFAGTFYTIRGWKLAGRSVVES